MSRTGDRNSIETWIGLAIILALAATIVLATWSYWDGQGSGGGFSGEIKALLIALLIIVVAFAVVVVVRLVRPKK